MDGKRLRMARQVLHLSQTDLAVLVGRGQTVISRWERGRVPHWARPLIAVCLGCKVQERAADLKGIRAWLKGFRGYGKTVRMDRGKRFLPKGGEEDGREAVEVGTGSPGDN